MVTSKGLGSWARSAFVIGVAVLFVFAMPLAAATNAPDGDGETHISNSGSCTLQLVVPVDQLIHLAGNPDTVYVRMNTSWFDERGSGSAALIHHFQVDAKYGSNTHTAQDEETTTGGMSSPSTGYIQTSWSVTPFTTMDVVYSVSVRYQSSGITLCSADNSNEPELTTFTLI